jgi:hypothetical protein
MVISKQRIEKRLLLLTSLLLALAICLPGCTTNGEQTATQQTSTKPSLLPTGSTSQSTTPASPTMPPTREIWPVNMPPDMMGRITEMLRLVPDNTEVSHEQVWFIDFEAWNRTLGINTADYRNISGQSARQSENIYISDLILSSMDTDDRVRPYWYPWLGQAPFISGMGMDWAHSFSVKGMIKYNPVRMDYTGYGPLDVESSILSSSIYKNSPMSYEAIKGNFNTTAINQAVAQYPEGYQQPQISYSNGIDIYSWDGGVDQSREYMTPIFDSVGSGRTIAVQPTFVIGSRQPVRVDEMIDASHGRMPSLADDPRYQELAEKLENMGSMSAVMSVDKILRQYLWPYKNSFFEKAASYAPLMGPYTAFAAGLSVDEKGMFVSLILLYESPDLAEKDIEVLKERLAAGTNSMNSPWAKEVDDSEIWVEGNALCAKLYGNVTSYWDCFVHQEPLLVRGE